MPFSCKAEIMADQIRQSPLIFDAWIDSAWDRYVDAGTAFANAHDSMGNCLLRLTGPGFLSSKPKISPGDEIRVGTIVAYFAADGEDIPYGRPYCTLDYNNVG
jgi:hypothetical protein